MFSSRRLTSCSSRMTTIEFHSIFHFTVGYEHIVSYTKNYSDCNVLIWEIHICMPDEFIHLKKSLIRGFSSMNCSRYKI